MIAYKGNCNYKNTEKVNYYMLPFDNNTTKLQYISNPRTYLQN